MRSYSRTGEALSILRVRIWWAFTVLLSVFVFQCFSKADAATIECPAMVSTSVAGAAQCLDGTGTSVAWVVVPDFDFSQIDSTLASGAFTAGFLMVGTAWAIGKGVSLVLKSIRS